jgi:hypothetical protein
MKGHGGRSIPTQRAVKRLQGVKCSKNESCMTSELYTRENSTNQEMEIDLEKP